MQLFYREIGNGKNIVILHGLYGSSDNWWTIARNLSEEFKVILPDLRNHGSSPHSEVFNIQAMTQDLKELFDYLKIKKSFLIGHSLGGKTALEFASLYPEMVTKLVIIDIAPKNYDKKDFEEHNNHQKIINYLSKIDLSCYSNRTDAINDLQKIDPTGSLFFFMAKNIKRNPDGKLEWKINLKAIADNLSCLMNDFSADLTKIACPVLFIKAENSNYLTNEDFEFIKDKIKNVEFKIIPNASHWVHSEKPLELVDSIKTFILP